MKRLQIFPFVLLGLAALWIGLWSGRSLASFAGRIASHRELEPARVSKDLPNPVQDPVFAGGYPLPNNIQTPGATPSQRPPLPGSRPPGSAAPTRQENLLIIGVDRLGRSAPTLKSVWLAIYMADRPHFMLLPVYPSQTYPGSDPGPDPTLPMQFSLTADGAPGAEFQKALKEKELWWTHYLVLDETALALLIDKTGQQPGQGSSRAEDALGSMPDPGEKPLEALLAQARLTQNLCLNSTRLVSGDPTNIARIYEQVRQHISTDVDLDEALVEWAARLQIGAITCEFPSLSTAMILP